MAFKAAIARAVVLGLTCTSLLVTNAVAQEDPIEDPERTRVGSVTLDGLYRVVDVTTTAVVRSDATTGTRQTVSATLTVLVPVDQPSPAAALSCTIYVLDADPEKTGGPTPKVQGFTLVEASSGCNSVNWTHTLYQYRLSTPPWASISTTSKTTPPGGSVSDIRARNCVYSGSANYLNDTNLSAGNTATVTCRVLQ